MTDAGTDVAGRLGTSSMRSEGPSIAPIAVLLSVGCVAAACAYAVGIANLDFPVKALLAFALALVAGALTYYRPVVFPFVAYLFMVPFDNLLQTGSGTVTKMLGIACAAVILLLLADRRRWMGPPAAVFMWGLFLVWNVASFMWSADPWFRPDLLVQTAQLFALFAVFSVLRIRIAELRALLVAVVAGGCVCAVYGVWQFTHGVDVAKNSALSHRLSIVVGNHGPFINADHFSAALVFPVALVMVAGLSLHGWRKALAAASLLVLMAGIYVSATRGSLIAVGAMWLYLMIAYRHRVQLLMLAGAALLASLPFPSMWLRFIDSSQGDAGGRFGIWAIAWRAFKLHWLGGIGTGQFRLAYQESYLYVKPSLNNPRPWMEDAHNLIASTAVELGVIGLLLILAAWCFQFRVGRSIPRTSSLFDMRVALEAATLGLFVNALSVDLMFYKYLWIAFTLGVLVRNAWLAEGEPVAATGMQPVPGRAPSEGLPIATPVRGFAPSSS
jgi:O-antigen ligase